MPAVLKNILKCPEASSHMIEHPVKNYLDPVVMKLSAHFLKIFIGSETAVYCTIIPRIIPMCIRFENRREINRINPQFLHVRNLVIHFQNAVLQLAVVLKRRPTEPQRVDLIKYTFVCPHSFSPIPFLFFIPLSTGETMSGIIKAKLRLSQAASFDTMETSSSFS